VSLRRARPARQLATRMRFLLAPLVAWTIAQTAKVIIYSVREHRLNLRRAGGDWWDA